MTPELKKRIDRVFNNAQCDECEGYASKGMSPSNPSGDPCDTCFQTGIANDGTRLRDVRFEIGRVIYEYIREFGGVES